jgi:tRNA(fMet)-specific endonuclease VapC
MLYLLDTDHLSLLERGGPEAERIAARLDVLGPDDYGISVVTYTEQARGWLAEIARATNPAHEVRAFAEMERSLTFCTAFAMWSFTTEAAERCADLKKQKLRVGTQDLRIAAIALATGATVVTRNTRDFSRIPGLRIEDWSV